MVESGHSRYKRRMHSSNFIEADRPSDEEVAAAAGELHAWGERNGWWPPSVTTYDAMDPIGKDEFDAIVERVLMSATASRQGVPAKRFYPLLGSCQPVSTPLLSFDSHPLRHFLLLQS